LSELALFMPAPVIVPDFILELVAPGPTSPSLEAPGAAVRGARTVVRYIDDRPSRLEEDFRELALEALRQAWPCRGRRNIDFAETP
jgi:hypothetical protein